MKDLPLQVKSRKLALWFVVLFEVERMVNVAAVCLKLPASMRVHPTFHVSRAKPVDESEPSPAADHRRHTVQQILDIHRRGRSWQYLVEWEAMVRRAMVWGDPAGDTQLLLIIIRTLFKMPAASHQRWIVVLPEWVASFRVGIRLLFSWFAVVDPGSLLSLSSGSFLLVFVNLQWSTFRCDCYLKN